MKCPECGCQQDKVIDSRLARDGAQVRRRRECDGCGFRFSTIEEIVPAELMVVKQGGRQVEEFDPGKVRRGVQRALWKRQVEPEVIDRLVHRITRQVAALGRREVSSHEIGEIVMAELRQVDQVAYVRFASVYRQFQDVEQFVSAIRTLEPEEGP